MRPPRGDMSYVFILWQALTEPTHILYWHRRAEWTGTQPFITRPRPIAYMRWIELALEYGQSEVDTRAGVLCPSIDCARDPWVSSNCTYRCPSESLTSLRRVLLLSPLIWALSKSPIVNTSLYKWCSVCMFSSSLRFYLNGPQWIYKEGRYVPITVR